MTQFNGQVPFPPRKIIRAARFPMPDGTVRQRIWTQNTYLGLDGALTTQEETILVPPLACSCVPERMNDVLQCKICHQLYCHRHVRECQNCQGWCCQPDSVAVKTAEREVLLCKNCADELMSKRLVSKLAKLIWG